MLKFQFFEDFAFEGKNRTIRIGTMIGTLLPTVNRNIVTELRLNLEFAISDWHSRMHFHMTRTKPTQSKIVYSRSYISRNVTLTILPLLWLFPMLRQI